MCKQISSNSYKNKNTYKLFTYKWYMYKYLTVCKQKIDVKIKLFVLVCNTWKYLTVFR